MTAPPWAAIAAARHDPQACRDPLRLCGVVVGSVARAAPAALLLSLAPWLRWGPQGWSADGTPGELSRGFEPLNEALRERGLITGWRNERFDIAPPSGGPALAWIERAAARFWGTLTLGAHANGYLADAAGRPTHLWIAVRSATKPTDPGRLDNLVGGGVPAGQTPFEALVREGWEEAGLDESAMRRSVQGRAGHTASPASVIEIQRPLPDCAGLGWQWERVHAWDLRLEAGVQPRNQDGEVAALHLLTVEDALARVEAAEMTVDAALVTLDFALRHRLLAPTQAHELADALAPLRVGPLQFSSMPA
jgi:8-oxo-dGTP pyrophosphatase MutT (NUDIX family)